MLSIEAFTGVTFVALFVATVISVILFGIAVESQLSFKQRTLLLILQICVALSIIVIWAVYYVKTNELIHSSENINAAVYATKTSCTVVEIQTSFDVSHNNNNFIVYYAHNSTQFTNTTKYHYSGVCAVSVKCWPNVNDTIICWPITENSIIIDYVMNPPLSDTKYYENHKNIAILIALYCIMLSLLIIGGVVKNYNDHISTIEIEGEQAQRQNYISHIQQQHIQQLVELEGMPQQPPQSEVRDGLGNSSIIVEPSVEIFQSEHNPSGVNSEHIPETASSAKSITNPICSI